MRLAVLALVACGTATTQESIDYVGGFAAQFPIPPTWRHTTHGVVVKGHAVEDRHAYEYSVRYEDVGGPGVVEATRDDIVRGAHLPIASEVAASLGDVRGTEITFERNNGDAAITRIFATATRVYVVTGAAPSKELVVQFLDSFRLVQ